MSEIKESTDYDNFVGKTEIVKASTIYDFGPEEKEVEVTNKWQTHWKGMPEYIQEDNPPYKKLLISFRNKEDYEEFAKVIDQNLTEKTKSMWYPALDRDANTLRRYIEND